MAVTLEQLKTSAYNTPWPGAGLCAKWVRLVFKNAGVGNFYGNAEDHFKKFCLYDVKNIEPGMILACDDSPTSNYGHIGIYLGNNVVRNSTSKGVEDYTLTNFVNWYSKKTPVKCGWLGNIKIQNNEEGVFDLAKVGIVKKGSTGTAVKILQAALNTVYGKKLTVDGICGNNTVNAIKEFQKGNGLTVDGVCGFNTWSKLFGV